jgi:hypothetical protein
MHGRLRRPEDLVAIEGIDGALANTIAKQANFDESRQCSR